LHFNRLFLMSVSHTEHTELWHRREYGDSTKQRAIICRY
jgi:hypothetical protein